MTASEAQRCASSRRSATPLAEGIFWACCLKPIAGIGAALAGQPLRVNEGGVPMLMPAVVSATLLLLGFACRGPLPLARIWSLIYVLSSAAFANRALRDLGIWTPWIELLIFPAAGYLIYKGAYGAMLIAPHSLIRSGAICFGLAAAIAAPLWLFPNPPHGSAQATALYCAVVASALCLYRTFSLERKI